jgi:hypothetical protein
MSSPEFGVLMAGAAVKGATTAVVRQFVDGVVFPYLRGMVSKKTEGLLRTRLFKYARILECKTRFISTIVRAAEPFQLDHIYEPMTVSAPSWGFSTVINRYPQELFHHSRCVAITDDAGMGKSTLAKYIARRSIHENRSIPLLIELRRIRPGRSILSSLCEELTESELADEGAQELVSLFEKGNFIFILDGFDEVDDEVRNDLVKEINHIASRFQFCYFMLTSRPEYSVSLFPEFAQFNIEKLSRQQAESLIERYDSGRGLAKLLIQKISQAGISEFLGNPLLVTLLYRAFDHRNHIPPKRTIFFRQVYDALFHDHDLAKGDAFYRRKECGLDLEDFHKLVRAIGFETFKSGRVSYTFLELVDFIDRSAKRSGSNVEPKKVAQDLLMAVPLFVRDGLEIKWCHKAFQEYFASQYIAYDLGKLKEDAIRKMFDSSENIKYREIFRFLGEIDPGVLNAVCIVPFLESLEAKVVEPEQWPVTSLFEAVDMYYIGSMSPSEQHRGPSRLIRDRLGIDIGDRRTAITVSEYRQKRSVLIGVLKEGGSRYLLLPLMEPSQFRKYSRSPNSPYISKWRVIFGGSAFHVNPDLQTLIATEKRLGSFQFIESVAHMHAVHLSSLQLLREQNQLRNAALAACALDDF